MIGYYCHYCGKEVRSCEHNVTSYEYQFKAPKASKVTIPLDLEIGDTFTVYVNGKYMTLKRTS